MKNLLLLLVIWVLTPLNYNYSTIHRNENVNVKIGLNEIIIISDFKTFSCKNKIDLEKGVNSGYYVLRHGQSFEYKIINY